MEGNRGEPEVSPGPFSLFLRQIVDLVDFGECNPREGLASGAAAYDCSACDPVTGSNRGCQSLAGLPGVYALSKPLCVTFMKTNEDVLLRAYVKKKHPGAP